MQMLLLLSCKAHHCLHADFQMCNTQTRNLQENLVLKPVAILVETEVLRPVSSVNVGLCHLQNEVGNSCSKAEHRGMATSGFSLSFDCLSPAGPRKSLHLSALASPFKNKKVILLISFESSLLLLIM